MKKLILLFILVCITFIVTGQTSFNYRYTANPQITNSQSTINTTITISSNLELVYIKQGSNSQKLTVVRLNAAPVGEYNVTFLSGERLYFTDGYAILYSVGNVAKQFWTNNEVTVK